MSETVRVRIAVVVDDKGCWSAVGWSDGDEKGMVNEASAGLDPEIVDSTLVHWVEAVVFVPNPQAVEGKVKP